MSSSGISFTGIDSSILTGYFNARIAAGSSTLTSSSLSLGSSTNSSTQAVSTSTTPWDSISTLSQQAQDAQTLANTPFLDLSNPAIVGAATTASAKQEQDVQKLFAMYQGLNRLSQLANIATRDTTTSGQLAGLNTRFQAGLAEVESYINKASFNNITLLAGSKVSSIVSSAAVPVADTTYLGGVVVKGKALFDPVPNISSSDSFKISVTKGGVTTDVPIDLSQVNGPLTLDNIASYVNSQLANAGFSTKIKRVVISDTPPASTTTSTSSTSKSAVDPITYETFGLQINTSASEKVSFSSDSSTAAVYVAGSTGTTAANDQQGRLTKLVNLNTSPTGEFTNNITPDGSAAATSTSTSTTSTSTSSTASAPANATAQSTVVDSQGNVYVLGNTTGNMDGQIEKGSSDVYLTKYDSAGNKLWTRLAGAEDSAQGFSLGLDPTGGVVIAGTTTGALTQTASGGGKDAFVAKYTADGTQKWLHQVSPLSADQAFAVSVDTSGNVYVGGQVSGTLAAGQTSSGGADATITKLDNKGNLVYRQQFGTSGTDQVSQVATTSDGGLVVASVQNGHAVVSKYANGDATSSPEWSYDLGDLKSGGTIGGIAVDGSKVYVSGTTSNTQLNAGGDADTINPSSGGNDAFVFRLDDAGTTATPNYVTYVGTSASDTGGGIAVANGKVYLTGTTRGAFAGQTQSFKNAQNMFVTQLDEDGSVDWSKQYGGVEGTSTGASIAVDTQGSSVLDKLGLPRGQITTSQSVNLVDQTTARAGDSFKMKITTATGVNEVTIRLDADETWSSLASKINTYLGTKGKASVTYNSKGSALKIAVNAGTEVQLESGPQNSDALAGLGISPGILVKDPAKGSTATAANKNTTPVYGLSIPKTMDLSTADGAKAARASMLSVLSALRTAYRGMNTPVTAAKTGDGSRVQQGGAPAYLTSQIASYTLALQQLGGGTSA